MSDHVVLEGKTYISSKRAAEISHYSRDYIGQLARGGLLDARRVGGLWYVAQDSLEEYQRSPDEARALPPEPAVAERINEPEAVITFDGRDYISATRAAALTGYHQDYIGQLARAEKVPSRQIGNRWYVDKVAIEDHKQAKDALLAAVQAESVGVARSTDAQRIHARQEPSELFYTYGPSGVGTTYIPTIAKEDNTSAELVVEAEHEDSPEWNPIKIKKTIAISGNRSLVGRGGGRRAYATAALLTFVVVATIGFLSFKSVSQYADTGTHTGIRYVASIGVVHSVGEDLSGWVEGILAQQLVYVRS